MNEKWLQLMITADFPVTLPNSDYFWKMNLNPSLFWDTNPHNLDYETHARYIIARVVQFGTLDEWKQVIAFYGNERIGFELQNERDLDIKTLHFLSCTLDIPLNSFRCYTERQ